MKNRDREIEVLLKAGRDVLEALDEGANPKALKTVFEAIRVQNTTLRTEIALEKLRRASEPKAKRVLRAA